MERQSTLDLWRTLAPPLVWLWACQLRAQLLCMILSSRTEFGEAPPKHAAETQSPERPKADRCEVRARASARRSLAPTVRFLRHRGESRPEDILALALFSTAHRNRQDRP